MNNNMAATAWIAGESLFIHSKKSMILKLPAIDVTLMKLGIAKMSG
jgi:hypothetical protein